MSQYYAVCRGNTSGVTGYRQTADRWRQPNGYAKKFETWEKAAAFVMWQEKDLDIYSLRLNPPPFMTSVFLFVDDKHSDYYIFSTFQRTWSFYSDFVSILELNEKFNSSFTNEWCGDFQAESMGFYKILELCRGEPRRVCIYIRRPAILGYINGFKEPELKNTPYFVILRKALELKKSLEALGWSFFGLVYQKPPLEDDTTHAAELFASGILVSKGKSELARFCFGQRFGNILEI